MNCAYPENYPIAQAGTLFYGTAAYSSANQIYGGYSSNRWFARGGGSGVNNKTTWREFAFTDSNVLSATKLANTRTIWGQSFNGTGNVSGQLYNAGSFHIGEGGNEINMVSDQPMYLGYRRTSEINIHTGTTGGTTNSSTAKFNNNGLYLYKGWFRSTGSVGWCNSTYGGGWYMSDSTWIRTYGSKSVYQDTG